jgi:hypothetical protein
MIYESMIEQLYTDSTVYDESMIYQLPTHGSAVYDECMIYENMLKHVPTYDLTLYDESMNFHGNQQSQQNMYCCEQRFHLGLPQGS